MKVNGVDVCFGKVVKLTVYAGNESVVLLYAPQLNEIYNANIEAEVEDIANPMRKNNELGFTAQVTITNPPASVVELISRHINWIQKQDENQQEFEKRIVKDLQSVLIDYYKNRARCRVEVGYWDYSIPPAPAEEIKDKETGEVIDYRTPSVNIPGLVKLFDGYINGSALYHDGTDDILKISCHNYNADQISTRAVQKELMCIWPEAERKRKLEEYAKGDYKKRSGSESKDWESMLRKLISNFSIMRPNPQYGTFLKMTNGIPYDFPTEIPVTEHDRVNTQWIQVFYVKSPNALDKPDEALRKKMQSFPVSDFYTNAGTLADMITDLCNFRNADVNWIQYDDYDGNHEHAVYFVYPRGSGRSQVDGERADIKIINYQNLLESPTASASGSMRIRMFLNTDCIPLRTLALILDEKVGAKTGTGNSFVVNAKGIFRESMGVNGKLSPYVGTQQLANSTFVYSQEIAAKDIKDKGYLFNKGFPIIKCTHKISTLGNDWETIVETVPVYQGLNVNFGSK